MCKWMTRLPKEFRAELKSFGKSYDGISKACDYLITTLNTLEKKAKKLDAPRLEVLIEEAKDHFVFCKELATGEIKQSEWEDYSFDGDLVGLFNDYINEFWNICDWVTNNKGEYDNDVQKFCWVEL